MRFLRLPSTLPQLLATSALAFGSTSTRPFWMTRLIAILLVALTGLVLAGLMLLIVFGGPLGTAIADKAGLGSAFELLWAILRWPIAFLAILLFFAIVYFLAPNIDVRLRTRVGLSV